MSDTWILDTDPGIDDAMALLYLKGEGVALMGLTTVFGNADIQRTTRNAAQLLELAQMTGWVAPGAGDPLVQLRHPPADFVHGVEGLGGIELPAPSRMPLPIDGANAIIQASHRTENLVLAAIGPLTNLAIALERDPTLPQRVKEVVIMGGTLDAPGNVSDTAEANIWNDPHAAQQVLRAGWPLRLIGLDVTSQIQLMREDFDVLPGTVGNHIKHAAGSYIDFYQSVGSEGCQLHDPAAVMAGLYPDDFDWEETGVDVVLEGEHAGRVVRDSSAPSIQVAMGSRIQTIKARFMDRLIAACRCD